MKNFICLIIIIGALGATGCRNNTAAPENNTPAEDSAAEIPASVTVSAEAQKTAGIITERLASKATPETFTATGRILQDAQKPHNIAAGAAGRMASVTAVLGQLVNSGDTLAVIAAAGGGAVPVLTRHKGIVTAVQTTVGEPVTEMSFLFTVTEIDPMAGVLDISERNLAQIKTGQTVTVKTAAYPREMFTGKVTFISPEIDSVSRTVKTGVAISNPHGLLKFGMFMDALVRTGASFYGLAVRSDAIQTDEHGPFVFVKQGPTEFAARPVVPGREANGLTEIIKGLRAGEQVVSEGSYLLKSEMMKSQMGED